MYGAGRVASGVCQPGPGCRRWLRWLPVRDFNRGQEEKRRGGGRGRCRGRQSSLWQLTVKRRGGNGLAWRNYSREATQLKSKRGLLFETQETSNISIISFDSNKKQEIKKLYQIRSLTRPLSFIQLLCCIVCPSPYHLDLLNRAKITSFLLGVAQGSSRSEYSVIMLRCGGSLGFTALCGGDGPWEVMTCIGEKRTNTRVFILY